MPATICLIVANVIAFAGYLFQSSFLGLFTYDGTVLFGMGAAYTPSILFLHEYWRLFTSLFLHANLQHIGLNMFSLFIFGRMLEKPMGSARFLVLYTVSGLFGGLSSMGMHRLDESVGASGAIFGLVGFYLSLQLQLDKIAHPGITYRMRQILGMALAFYCISLTPGVDNAAHFGGLLAGIICGGTFQRFSDISDMQIRWCWRDSVITTVFAALFVGTLYGEECTIGQDKAMPAALLLRQSVAYLQSNDLSRALNTLDKSLDMEPKNERALLLRATTNHNLGHYTRALADATAALALKPGDAMAKNQQACAYLAMGRYEEALAAARQAIELDRHLPLSLDTEAVALAYLGLFDKALVAINRAIEEDNGDAGIYFYHRSSIYAALGDSGNAAADLRQAHKLGFELDQWEIDRPLSKAQMDRPRL